VLGWRMTALQANPFVLGIPLFISATEDAGRFFITPGRRPRLESRARVVT